MQEGQESFCPQESAWHAYCTQGTVQPVASTERMWEVTQAWKMRGKRGGERVELDRKKNQDQARTKPKRQWGDREPLQRQWEISEGSGS